jgi:hypothetical protein
LLGGIVPLRVRRDRPGSLPSKIRSDSASQARYPDVVPFCNGDMDRNFLLEISLNDFGLETIYGRFLRDKIYSLDTPALCGVYVDLYV